MLYINRLFSQFESNSVWNYKKLIKLNCLLTLRSRVAYELKKGDGERLLIQTLPNHEPSSLVIEKPMSGSSSCGMRNLEAGQINP